MHLYVHLGRKRAFSIVCPLHCDGSYDDFEDNSIASETSDYKPFQKMFESLWEDAEPITSEKIDAFPDQHQADLLRRMLNPVYHEPENT